MSHFSCLFLLGTGSVLTSDGKIEMDAMIMEGETLRAGSVACVQNIAHPVSLARMVMEKVNYNTCMQNIAHPVHLSRMVMLFSPTLTLSSLNLPLSSSSTTSCELLSQFSICSG